MYRRNRKVLLLTYITTKLHTKIDLFRWHTKYPGIPKMCSCPSTCPLTITNLPNSPFKEPLIRTVVMALVAVVTSNIGL